VDENRLREHIARIAPAGQDINQLIQWFYSDEQRKAQLESVVLEEQIIALCDVP